MNELRQKAKEMLESGRVQLVIGYEEVSGNKVRAAFINSGEKADCLVYNSRCIQNLAVYLTRKDMLESGCVAITATIPVMRSIIQLASENQVKEESLKILGLLPGGEIKLFERFRDMDQFLQLYKQMKDECEVEMLNRVSQMTPSERWKFWLHVLEPCFKCYACRAACPLCYCSKCSVEINRPQWVPVPSHHQGNIEWHIMRALHMAGRCTGCDACATACPLGIPLNLLTRQVQTDMEINFAYTGPALENGHMMSTFKPEDKENFIK